MAEDHREVPTSHPRPDRSPPRRDDSPSRRDDSPSRRDDSPRRAWAVGADGTGCDHPIDSLRAVGDDGWNVFVRCERCTSVLVTQIVAGRPKRGQKLD